MEINSYPTVFAIGHKAIPNLLFGAVLIEEKVDGSQFSFSVDEDGQLHVRSKGAVIYPEDPPSMFRMAVETVTEKKDVLHPGWVYRGEVLAKPKHNTLAYERVPIGNIILFDIVVGPEDYLSYGDKSNEAERIGLEVVPKLGEMVVSDTKDLLALLETTSVLGGQLIEGFVVKNYQQFSAEKKIAVGKFVSERFKEVHGKEWKLANPTSKDIVQTLGERLRTEARWQKAIQHLTEQGLLEQSPRDIGLLIKEVPIDVLKEEEDRIRDALFGHFWPKIRRIVTAGLPEWYKEQLLGLQETETP